MIQVTDFFTVIYPFVMSYLLEVNTMPNPLKVLQYPCCSNFEKKKKIICNQ